MGAQRTGSITAPLQYRPFRMLIIGAAFSDAGSWAYKVALTVYVYERTHSATWAGVVTVARVLPSVVFGPYAGVLADRYDRVRMMRRLDSTCAVLMGLLAIAAALEAAPVLMVALAAIVALLGRAYDPAAAALTPQLVSEDDLAAANTLRTTVSNIAVIVGPSIGALLLLSGPPADAFALDTVCYLISAATVSTIKIRSPRYRALDVDSSRTASQMLVGFRSLASSGSALVLAAYSVVASFVYGTDTVMFIVLAEHRLAAGVSGYDLLLAGVGLGGLLAAAPVGRISASPRLGAAITAGILLYCAPTLALLIMPRVSVAFLVEVIRGAGYLLVNVLGLTALQRTLSRHVLARGLAAYFALSVLALSLGAMVTPMLLRASGITTTLWVISAGVPVLCLGGWPFLARMDRANLARVRELTPRVALLQAAALFAEAPRSALERLAAATTELSVEPGTDVVREGERADALYIVKRGELVVHDHAGPEQRNLAYLAEGEYFGEIGLLRSVPRTATVTAITRSELLRVDGDAFLDVLVTSPASASLLEGAASRLARTSTPPRRVESTSER